MYRLGFDWRRATNPHEDGGTLEKESAQPRQVTLPVFVAVSVSCLKPNY